MTTIDNLAAARFYAERGWPVFPVYPIRGKQCACANKRCDAAGKHPCTTTWQNTIASVPAAESAWSSEHGLANRGIGLACGPRAGLWALDVDPDRGGHASIVALQELHGRLPRTLTTRTGGGGWHLLFEWPEDGGIANSADVIAPGLDVRGAGGFIVLPPSPHIGGTAYSWLRLDPVVAAPGWLLELGRSRKKRGPSSSPRQRSDDDRWVAMLRDGVPEGRRDVLVTGMVGHLLGHGIDAHETAEWIYLLNEGRVRPPMERAQVDKIVDSIVGSDLDQLRERLG